MQVSVILGHPQKRSFNHAIANYSSFRKNGHRIYFHDLYEEKFDPLLFAVQ